MIEAIDLQKTFGTFQAVRGINLSIAAGEVVALLGPNGAGKTTTVRMLGAILKPTAGHAIVAGRNVVTHARDVRNTVGLLTEFPGLYLRMKPLEYLDFFGELQGMHRSATRSRGEALLKQFGLWEARDKRLDSYSKGMKQKVALIRALLHDPPVLYLDEPTTAMDPHSARIVRDAIAELRAAKRTILLTTHNLSEAEDLADRIVVIRGGQIIAEGTHAQLTRQLLGDPIWELQFEGDLARVLPLVATHAEPIEHGPGWLRYRTAHERQVNPAIIATLAEQHIYIISLAALPRRLEDVYLSIISDQHERGIWSNASNEAHSAQPGVTSTLVSEEVRS
jgi:ABC-2 type transport system ATP-binding protein